MKKIYSLILYLLLSTQSYGQIIGKSFDISLKFFRTDSNSEIKSNLIFYDGDKIHLKLNFKPEGWNDKKHYCYVFLIAKADSSCTLIYPQRNNYEQLPTSDTINKIYTSYDLGTLNIAPPYDLETLVLCISDKPIPLDYYDFRGDDEKLNNLLLFMQKNQLSDVWTKIRKGYSGKGIGLSANIGPKDLDFKTYAFETRPKLENKVITGLSNSNFQYNSSPKLQEAENLIDRAKDAKTDGDISKAKSYFLRELDIVRSYGFQSKNYTLSIKKMIEILGSDTCEKIFSERLHQRKDSYNVGYQSKSSFSVNDLDDYISPLNDLAEFYKQTGKYTEQAKTYNTIINILEHVSAPKENLGEYYKFLVDNFNNIRRFIGSYSITDDPQNLKNAKESISTSAIAENEVLELTSSHTHTYATKDSSEIFYSPVPVPITMFNRQDYPVVGFAEPSLNGAKGAEILPSTEDKKI